MPKITVIEAGVKTSFEALTVKNPDPLGKMKYYTC
jgi:hypothetical protein